MAAEEKKKPLLANVAAALLAGDQTPVIQLTPFEALMYQTLVADMLSFPIPIHRSWTEIGLAVGDTHINSTIERVQEKVNEILTGLGYDLTGETENPMQDTTDSLIH